MAARIQNPLNESYQINVIFNILALFDKLLVRAAGKIGR